MSQISFLDGLLMNLRQEIQRGRREYLSQDRAYELLKQSTGQDFGYDFDQWETWIVQHPKSIRFSPRRTDA